MPAAFVEVGKRHQDMGYNMETCRCPTTAGCQQVTKQCLLYGQSSQSVGGQHSPMYSQCSDCTALHIRNEPLELGMSCAAMAWSERYGETTLSRERVVGGGAPALLGIGGFAALIIGKELTQTVLGALPH